MPVEGCKDFIPVRGMDDDAICEKILGDSMGEDAEWRPITYDEDDENFFEDSE